MKKNYRFLAVDVQNEFMHPDGCWFNRGTSPYFIQSTLLPYLQEKKCPIVEIISDYGAPRPGHSTNGCIPGTFGYLSVIPSFQHHGSYWVKSMHNPIWIRNPLSTYKTPVPCPDLFTHWLEESVGSPEETIVILFGLTMEVCVMNVCQELYFRGYESKLIIEGTDPMNERLQYKGLIAQFSSLGMYTEVTTFDQIKQLL